MADKDVDLLTVTDHHTRPARAGAFTHIKTLLD